MKIFLTYIHRYTYYVYVYVLIVTYFIKCFVYLSIHLSIPKYSLTTSCLILCCRNTKHAKLNVSTNLCWEMKWSQAIPITNIRVNSTSQEVANLCCVFRLNIISINIYFYHHQHKKGQPFCHCTITKQDFHRPMIDRKLIATGRESNKGEFYFHLTSY